MFYLYNLKFIVNLKILTKYFYSQILGILFEKKTETLFDITILT
jgi:hypothetical protein